MSRCSTTVVSYNYHTGGNLILCRDFVFHVFVDSPTKDGRCPCFGWLGATVVEPLQRTDHCRFRSVLRAFFQ